MHRVLGRMNVMLVNQGHLPATGQRTPGLQLSDRKPSQRNCMHAAHISIAKEAKPPGERRGEPACDDRHYRLVLVAQPRWPVWKKHAKVDECSRQLSAETRAKNLHGQSAGGHLGEAEAHTDRAMALGLEIGWGRHVKARVLQLDEKISLVELRDVEMPPWFIKVPSTMESKEDDGASSVVTGRKISLPVQSNCPWGRENIVGQMAEAGKVDKETTACLAAIIGRRVR
ncbi:predicted protein [Plenodomus lingam JN3]|uniref:Predicted protein n=1 Tax=Leptosphaeria maculans (strain JN3 / isolate v23.1.3 / race Av1-4-5-6-7-8) TaxID=985895 RepID=E4ZLP8_LEPMJ|nr:predicted protein [Plenodomus lingam JN3]CBX92728.1 predicted protein [Plenodomus lingam JN3]